MKYNAPSNTPATILVPEPPYIDGNPAGGIKGSIPPAAAIEHPMREILNVITFPGLVPTESDLTQLLQAIQLMISSAISGIGGGGGGGGSGAVPTDFARFPIYPEIKTGGGYFTVSAITGQVTIDAGQQFVWRGGILHNTTDTVVGDRQFATVANKTYHLRWRYNGGTPIYQLLDLADISYNPSAGSETATGFDSNYDDMLIARVVTNGANTPTVVPLLNIDRHIVQGTAIGPKGTLGVNTAEGVGGGAGVLPTAITQFQLIPLNFARKADAYLSVINDLDMAKANEMNIGVMVLDRYQARVWAQGDLDTTIGWTVRL